MLRGLAITDQIIGQPAISQPLGIERAELFGLVEQFNRGKRIVALRKGSGEASLDPRAAGPQHIGALIEPDRRLDIAQLERGPASGDQRLNILRIARQLAQRIVELHPGRPGGHLLDNRLADLRQRSLLGPGSRSAHHQAQRRAAAQQRSTNRTIRPSGHGASGEPFGSRKQAASLADRAILNRALTRRQSCLLVVLPAQKARDRNRWPAAIIVIVVIVRR